MNGARSLVGTLLLNGIDTCFANPGTSEMHFVAALDQAVGMRCVLGLQENVVTGMADGYWRMAGKPACTLLHCGPGLANGLANLHNAKRAHAGIVNIVGDQATWHRPFDPPLNTDTEGLARTVSSWFHTCNTAQEVGSSASQAVQVARNSQGQIATLILPSDTCWDEGGQVGPKLTDSSSSINMDSINQAALILKTNGERVLLLLAGAATLEESQTLLWQISQATQCGLMVDYVVGRVARGQGRIPLPRVPYNSDAAAKELSKYTHIILVNAKAPIGFFAYPNKPSQQYTPGTQISMLTNAQQNPIETLQALVHALKAPKASIPLTGEKPVASNGAPSSEKLAQTVAALMPENAIVSDESVSYGRGFYPLTYAAAPHDWLHLAGGAIGAGLPMATGAAVGAQGKRRVISLQADGSAMYSLQALWTQAREKLPVTTILLNNHKYAILINELNAVGATPGVTAMNMLDLGNPNLNWVDLARGMGVEAARASTMEECADLMKQSFQINGPFLIELMI